MQKQTIIAGSLSVIFTAAGLPKLLGHPQPATQFSGWGYPRWFMRLTGLIEVVAAGLVAYQPTRFFGTLLIIPTMVGAVITHLRAGERVQSLVPGVLLVLAAWLGGDDYWHTELDM